jgi:hypothetical protein
MHHPTHVDGRSVVILRQGRRGFHVLESGWLNYDGRGALARRWRIAAGVLGRRVGIAHASHRG